jgi:hypothetical protein
MAKNDEATNASLNPQTTEKYRQNFVRHYEKLYDRAFMLANSAIENLGESSVDAIEADKIDLSDFNRIERVNLILTILQPMVIRGLDNLGCIHSAIRENENFLEWCRMMIREMNEDD